MPCNSEYLAPTRREIELARAAKLAVYVLTKLNRTTPAKIADAAKDYYSNDVGQVEFLCKTLSDLDAKTRDAIIYDARNKTARDLANWWEDHQAADQERIRQEKIKEDRNKLVRSALKKLTPEEKKALQYHLKYED